MKNPADHCVYSRENEDGKVILIMWVNDLIIVMNDVSNEKALKALKKMLKARFQMKDFEKLKHFSVY